MMMMMMTMMISGCEIVGWWKCAEGDSFVKYRCKYVPFGAFGGELNSVHFRRGYEVRAPGCDPQKMFEHIGANLCNLVT